MNLRKVVSGVKAVADIASAANPGERAGKVVSAAVTLAHPVIGTVAAKPIEKVTAKVVNGGIAIAKNPEVQAKVKEVGSAVGRKAIEIGSDAGRAARRGVGSAAAKVREFKAGHGR